jgi:hypothetical protein
MGGTIESFLARTLVAPLRPSSSSRYRMRRAPLVPICKQISNRSGTGTFPRSIPGERNGFHSSGSFFRVPSI